MKRFYLKKLLPISVNNEAAVRQPKRYVPLGSSIELNFKYQVKETTIY